MRPCQGRDGSSILPSRTEEMRSKTILVIILILIILSTILFLNKLRFKDYLVFTREQSAESLYNNKEVGYALKYPKNWFLKDITYDSRDEISDKWESVVLFSDKPIMKNREAGHLPSYGLLVTVSSDWNYQQLSCSNVKSISENAGSVKINDQEYDRCLDLGIGGGYYYVNLVNNGKLYSFSYPKDLIDESTANMIISSFSSK